MVALLRIFFRLLYHQFAWSYDFVSATVSAGQWQTWIRSALPYLNGPRILEIGFGPGHLQVEMFSRDLHPIGLDGSRQMAIQAFRRLKRMGVTALLGIGYAQFLPFHANSFNQVVSTFPSEYIFDNRTHAEILRILVPGGCLVIVPAAWITGRSLPHRFLAWVFRLTGESPPPPTSGLLENIKRPFQQSGFETEARLVDYPNSRVLLLFARKPAG